MKRFTLYRHGNIMGTYAGENEVAALDALSKDEGYANFEAACKARKMKRDDHRVVEVEE
jgi:hypothetical protein